MLVSLSSQETGYRERPPWDHLQQVPEERTGRGVAFVLRLQATPTPSQKTSSHLSLKQEAGKAEHPGRRRMECETGPWAKGIGPS